LVGALATRLPKFELKKMDGMGKKDDQFKPK
jgi:hypothetical protein